MLIRMPYVDPGRVEGATCCVSWSISTVSQTLSPHSTLVSMTRIIVTYDLCKQRCLPAKKASILGMDCNQPAL